MPVDFEQRLKYMTSAAVEPFLTDPEILELLAMFALEDSDGNAPSAAEWEPTYNLNKAASEGWRWKAGKLAAMCANLDAGSNVIAAMQQKFEHCERMAKYYSGRTALTVNVSAAKEAEMFEL